ncbi:MAG: hypothetical protein PHY93_19140 [Bacteriovorax sp.]|nr:hypothetical protein [Bacteriovorax sp.]
MNNKKTKWLAYTVLVGFTPIICRIFAWLVAKNNTVELLASSDFVALGLVLHISIINEIEHMSDFEQSWKTGQNGFSIAFITFYGVFFAMTLIGGDIVDVDKLKYCVIALAVVSLFISYSVFDRISKIPGST